MTRENRTTTISNPFGARSLNTGFVPHIEHGSRKPHSLVKARQFIFLSVVWFRSKGAKFLGVSLRTPIEPEFAFSVRTLVANSVKQFTGLALQLERGV